MKKLTRHFTLFTELTKHDFSVSVLNASKTRSIPYPFQPYATEDTYKMYKKVVKSDFIRRYKQKKSDLSIGFVFDYLDKNEEDWLINVTIKTSEDNSSIFNSPMYTLNEFKKIMNAVNKELTASKKTNSGVILNLITSSFMSDDFDLEKEVSKVEAELLNVLKETEADFDEKINERAIARYDNIELNKKFIKYTQGTSEYKEIAQLKAKILELENNLEIKKSNWKVNNHMQSLIEKIKLLDLEIEKIQFIASEKMKDFKKKLPKLVLNKMKKFLIKK